MVHIFPTVAFSQTQLSKVCTSTGPWLDRNLELVFAKLISVQSLSCGTRLATKKTTGDLETSVIRALRTVRARVRARAHLLLVDGRGERLCTGIGCGRHRVVVIPRGRLRMLGVSCCRTPLPLGPTWQWRSVATLLRARISRGLSGPLLLLPVHSIVVLALRIE